MFGLIFLLLFLGLGPFLSLLLRRQRIRKGHLEMPALTPVGSRVIIIVEGLHPAIQDCALGQAQRLVVLVPQTIQGDNLTVIEVHGIRAIGETERFPLAIHLLQRLVVADLQTKSHLRQAVVIAGVAFQAQGPIGRESDVGFVGGGLGQIHRGRLVEFHLDGVGLRLGVVFVIGGGEPDTVGAVLLQNQLEAQGLGILAHPLGRKILLAIRILQSGMAGLDGSAGVGHHRDLGPVQLLEVGNLVDRIGPNEDKDGSGR